MICTSRRQFQILLLPFFGASLKVQENAPTLVINVIIILVFYPLMWCGSNTSIQYFLWILLFLSIQKVFVLILIENIVASKSIVWSCFIATVAQFRWELNFSKLHCLAKKKMLFPKSNDLKRWLLAAKHYTLNDWSRGDQWILFPKNLIVSWDEVEGNIEIRGKQNSLLPKGPVIRWFVI